MSKTVFISSTYKDLKDHRREVWNTLKSLGIAVRGMEEFGARTTEPLATCLAEVEQSDVYAGIVAYRLGSVDPKTQEPFTLLEYKKAAEQGKEILIYLADDGIAYFPNDLMDQDPQARESLAAFKRTLRERHTVDTFSSPNDLVEKLSRDFRKRFPPEDLGQAQSSVDEDAFANAERALAAFLLTPKRLNGREVRLRVAFKGVPFPASRKLCQRFNLDYGFTVGVEMQVIKPAGNGKSFSMLGEIYATGNSVDALLELVQAGEGDLYAQLQFTEGELQGVRANYWGTAGSYAYVGGCVSGSAIAATTMSNLGITPQYIPGTPPEGKVILLFTKAG
ncbi:MAG: DUF4062 domain-containing protein [Bryobacteraceae bacterium]